MKTLITIVVLLVIGWALYTFVIEDNKATAPTTDTTTSAVDESTSNVKTFTVVGENFSFSPTTMEVNKGDTVRIVFQNSVGIHDWVIDEFNAKTKVLNGGESETIEFVADKTGSFEYYCSIGTHRQMGMKGTLTVK